MLTPGSEPVGARVDRRSARRRKCSFGGKGGIDPTSGVVGNQHTSVASAFPANAIVPCGQRRHQPRPDRGHRNPGPGAAPRPPPPSATSPIEVTTTAWVSRRMKRHNGQRQLRSIRPSWICSCQPALSAGDHAARAATRQQFRLRLGVAAANAGKSRPAVGALPAHSLVSGQTPCRLRCGAFAGCCHPGGGLTRGQRRAGRSAQRRSAAATVPGHHSDGPIVG